jgi:cytoskeletal protein CcmA (bactofilin family)
MNTKDSFFGKRDDKMRKDVGNIYGMGAGTTSTSTASSASGVGSTGSGLSATEGSAGGEERKGNKLIVGPDIKLKGEINDCDTIIVEGRVEATTDTRMLQIAESGSFSGTVGMEVAEIHGKFQGELTARQKLVIYASGSVSGKIRYGKIVIEEGGELSGDVAALPGAAQSASTSSSKTSESSSSESKGSDYWSSDASKGSAKTASA